MVGWNVIVYDGRNGEILNSYSVKSNPLIIDTDYDGLTDYQESLFFSDPNKTDTDGDGLSDYDESMILKDESPISLDGRPPSISNLSVSYTTKNNILNMPYEMIISIKYDCEDSAGVYFSSIKSNLLSDEYYYLNNANKSSVSYENSISFINILISKININITVIDTNYNNGYYLENISSLIEKVTNIFVIKVISIIEITVDMFKFIEGIITYFDTISLQTINSISVINEDDFIYFGLLNAFSLYNTSLLKELFNFIIEKIMPIIKSIIDFFLMIYNFLKGLPDYFNDNISIKLENLGNSLIENIINKIFHKLEETPSLDANNNIILSGSLFNNILLKTMNSLINNENIMGNFYLLTFIDIIKVISTMLNIIGVVLDFVILGLISLIALGSVISIIGLCIATKTPYPLLLLILLIPLCYGFCILYSSLLISLLSPAMFKESIENFALIICLFLPLSIIFITIPKIMWGASFNSVRSLMLFSTLFVIVGHLSYWGLINTSIFNIPIGGYESLWAVIQDIIVMIIAGIGEMFMDFFKLLISPIYLLYKFYKNLGPILKIRVFLLIRLISFLIPGIGMVWSGIKILCKRIDNYYSISNKNNKIQNIKLLIDVGILIGDII